MSPAWRIRSQPRAISMTRSGIGGPWRRWVSAMTARRVKTDREEAGAAGSGRRFGRLGQPVACRRRALGCDLRAADLVGRDVERVMAGGDAGAAVVGQG